MIVFTWSTISSSTTSSFGRITRVTVFAVMIIRIVIVFVAVISFRFFFLFFFHFRLKLCNYYREIIYGNTMVSCRTAVHILETGFVLGFLGTAAFTFLCGLFARRFTRSP